MARITPYLAADQRSSKRDRDRDRVTHTERERDRDIVCGLYGPLRLRILVCPYLGDENAIAEVSRNVSLGSRELDLIDPCVQPGQVVVAQRIGGHGSSYRVSSLVGSRRKNSIPPLPTEIWVTLSLPEAFWLADLLFDSANGQFPLADIHSPRDNSRCVLETKTTATTRGNNYSTPSSFCFQYAIPLLRAARFETGFGVPVHGHIGTGASDPQREVEP